MERTVVNCTPHFRLFSDSCQTARERCPQEFWSCCCISGYSKLPMQRLPFSFPSDDRSLPAQPHFSPRGLSAAGSPCTSHDLNSCRVLSPAAIILRSVCSVMVVANIKSSVVLSLSMVNLLYCFFSPSNFRVSQKTSDSSDLTRWSPLSKISNALITQSSLLARREFFRTSPHYKSAPIRLFCDFEQRASPKNHQKVELHKTSLQSCRVLL